MVFNCIGWMTYGLLTRDYFVFWANAPGVVLGSFYVLSCLRVVGRKLKSGSDQDENQQLLANEIAFVVSLSTWLIIGMISTITYNLSDPYDYAQIKLLNGLVSNMAGLAYYASPLSTIYKVMKTRDATSLHTPMIIANMMNGSMWTCYGFLAVHDALLWVPNFVGIIFAAFQLVLISLFPNGRTPYQVILGLPKEEHIDIRIEDGDVHVIDMQMKQIVLTDNPLHTDINAVLDLSSHSDVSNYSRSSRSSTSSHKIYHFHHIDNKAAKTELEMDESHHSAHSSKSHDSIVHDRTMNFTSENEL